MRISDNAKHEISRVMAEPMYVQHIDSTSDTDKPYDPPLIGWRRRGRPSDPATARLLIIANLISAGLRSYSYSSSFGLGSSNWGGGAHLFSLGLNDLGLNKK